MKLMPTRSQWTFIGLSFGILVILTSFQNCGTQDYSDSLVAPSEPGVDASNADGIPFAYDYKANQITYMSCSHSRDEDTAKKLKASITHLDDPNTFFTFKVGSYEAAKNFSTGGNYGSGGLTIRKEFIDHVITKLKFQGTVSDTNIQNALTNATAHGGAALQLAIRDSTPIATSVIYFDPQTENSDYDLFPQGGKILASNEFLPQLVDLVKSPLPRLTSLGTAALQTYRLEGAIHFETKKIPLLYDEQQAQLVREQLSSASSDLNRLLTVTFSKDQRVADNFKTNYYATSTTIDGAENRVWGQGFKLKFSAMPVGIRWKANILSSVTESDLSTFSNLPSSTWSCPEQLRYVIVSPQDRNDGGAYPCKDPPLVGLTPQQSNDLAILKRQLSTADWIIDPINQCVSPRKASLDCYANRAFNTVDYLGSATRCGLDDNNNYLHRDCAEFVSVCLRNN